MSAHQLHRALARLNLRCFNVRPQRIQILRTPTAFYESLIERCDRATGPLPVTYVCDVCNVRVWRTCATHATCVTARQALSRASKRGASLAWNAAAAREAERAQREAAEAARREAAKKERPQGRYMDRYVAACMGVALQQRHIDVTWTLHGR